MKTKDAAPDEGAPRVEESRLDSWKEIAAHFQRDVRTVRRWEVTEGLPIHRHCHRKRGSVYAYKSELDAWWTNGRRRQPAATVPNGRSARLWLRASLTACVLLAAGASYVGFRMRAGTAAPAIDPDTYRLYLQGRYHLQRRAGQLLLARQYLESAVGRAPGFAPVHASLADVYSRLARVPDGEPDAWTHAEASARRAVALDDTLPLAHAMLGTISLFRNWDWSKAEAEVRRAAVLAPRDPDVCNAYAIFLRAVGAMEAAIAQRRRALDGDPLNVVLITRLGHDYLFARRYDDGMREFEKALELEPDYRPALDGLAEACARKGLEQRAGAYSLRLLTLRGPKATADQFERLLRSQGYRAAARWLDERDLERYRQNPSANGWNLAFTYARLGDKESAFQWLEAAFASRDAGLLQMRVDPDIDALRSDPRFAALLRRLGPNASAPAR